jgi:hypothetical protein
MGLLAITAMVAVNRDAFGQEVRLSGAANPKVAAGEYSLDGAHKTPDLIGKAAHYSRMEMPRIKSLLQHRARPYTPLYT